MALGTLQMEYWSDRFQPEMQNRILMANGCLQVFQNAVFLINLVQNHDGRVVKRHICLLSKNFIYHDLDLTSERIGDGTVIRLKALPTCNGLKTCWECTTQASAFP